MHRSFCSLLRSFTFGLNSFATRKRPLKCILSLSLSLSFSLSVSFSLAFHGSREAVTSTTSITPLVLQVGCRPLLVRLRSNYDNLLWLIVLANYGDAESRSDAISRDALRNRLRR